MVRDEKIILRDEIYPKAKEFWTGSEVFCFDHFKAFLKFAFYRGIIYGIDTTIMAYIKDLEKDEKKSKKERKGGEK